MARPVMMVDTASSLNKGKLSLVMPPVTVTLNDHRAGYVEPIFLQPLCTTCHGKSIDPRIAAQLADQYPHDEATGFDVGELRGVFWAEFPDDAAESP